MAGFKQEMPPSGGYAPFEYAQKPKGKRLGGKWMIAGYIGWTIAAVQWYKYQFRQNVTLPDLENREANIALEPLLLAERNRQFLKRLIDNREYEKEAMKDVPGWIPGTYYGSPIYHRKDIWMDPSAEEFWAHSSQKKGYFRQQTEKHWH